MYVLQPEVIEWIANAVDEFQKSDANNPELALLNEQLKDVNKSLSNVMKAIEEGIITSTTKARLKELEGEQGRLIARITLEKANQFTATREQVIAWLESYKDGDIDAPEFQADLFNTFLVAAYFFDDDEKIKLVFSISGEKHKIIFKNGKIEMEDGSSAVRINSVKDHQSRIRRTFISGLRALR